MPRLGGTKHDTLTSACGRPRACCPFLSTARTNIRGC